MSKTYHKDQTVTAKHRGVLPEPAHVWVNGRLVGMCPAGVTQAEAQALLDRAIWDEDDEGYPARGWALDDSGHVYQFKKNGTPPSTYHGFPEHVQTYRRHCPNQIQKQLEAAAQNRGLAKEMERWFNSQPKQR